MVVEQPSGTSAVEMNETEFDDDLLVHQLDISRRTVESLDRSMTKIRQLNFIILSIIIAGVINLVREVSLPFGFLALQGTTVLIFIVSMTLWLLDSHYHRYLRISIRTCLAIERRLGFNLNNSYGLTTGLEHIRKNSQGGKRIPFLLYLIMPLTGMVILASFANIYYGIYGADSIYFIGIIAIIGSLLIFISWAERMESFIKED